MDCKDLAEFVGTSLEWFWFKRGRIRLVSPEVSSSLRGTCLQQNLGGWVCTHWCETQQVFWGQVLALLPKEKNVQYAKSMLRVPVKSSLSILLLWDHATQFIN